jgi:hypothetical protein
LNFRPFTFIFSEFWPQIWIFPNFLYRNRPFIYSFYPFATALLLVLASLEEPGSQACHIWDLMSPPDNAPGEKLQVLRMRGMLSVSTTDIVYIVAFSERWTRQHGAGIVGCSEKSEARSIQISESAWCKVGTVGCFERSVPHLIDHLLSKNFTFLVHAKKTLFLHFWIVQRDLNESEFVRL